MGVITKGLIGKVKKHEHKKRKQYLVTIYDFENLNPKIFSYDSEKMADITFEHHPNARLSVWSNRHKKYLTVETKGGVMNW